MDIHHNNAFASYAKVRHTGFTVKLELVRLDAISQAIQKAASIDVAKDIRDRA